MTTEVAVPTTAGTRTIALVVAAALFMENIDSTILSTALPTIATTDLNVNPLALNSATSYLISLAIFIPPSGWIADRFGARRVFARPLSALHGRIGRLHHGLLAGRLRRRALPGWTGRWPPWCRSGG